MLIRVTASSYHPREAWVTSANPTIDLLPDGGGFSVSFYRQMVRNTFDAPTRMEPLRRQRQAPRIYIRTIDEGGRAIDSSTLRIVVESLSGGIVEAFSGGRFNLLGIEQGTETRVGMPGWITVRWPTSLPEGRCGQASVGGDWIELVDLPSRCASRTGGGTYPRLVKHELGHAMGFWHTDDRNDVMFNASTNDNDNNPSVRERLHARIAYQRPIGSTDIDVDPIGATLSLPSRVVN